MICHHKNIKILKVLYDNNVAGCMENSSLKICHCQDCGVIFKYRYQFDVGCGNDNFMIFPGETERGIDFPLYEFFEILKEHPELLNTTWDDILDVDNISLGEIKISIVKLNEIERFYKNLLKKIVEKYGD